MTHRNTEKYIHILTDIIESYNNTIHKGLGTNQRPNQIHQLKDPNIN